MEQVILGGTSNSLNDTDTEYNNLTGQGGPWAVTEFAVAKLVSTGGKIKGLRVKLDGTPGAGKSYAFTLMVGGSPTALTLTISDAETSGNDANEVTVSAGQTVSLRCIPSGTPTVREATWTTIFQGDTVKESLILGGQGSFAVNTTSDRYEQVMGHGAFPTATEDDFRQVVPTDGTIKNL